MGARGMPLWADMGRRLRGERGANLIEMALVLPLLLLLVAGIVDFGGAFNRYTIITNSAREGARYGARFPFHREGIEEAVIEEASGYGLTLTAADNIYIDPDPDTAPAASGSPITVTVTYTHTTFLGAGIGAGNIPLRSSTEMIVFGLD